jgi:hypothetical protein
MPDYAIGQRRDAHTDIETLARDSGPIRETAVQDLIRLHAPFFRQVGPDLRHRLTGETIEQFVKGRRKSNPNDYADYSPELTDDQLLHETIEAAMLTPSPARLGKLYKLVGGPRYDDLVKAWGCDPARMLAGTRPGYAEREAAQGKSNEEAQAASRNPWHLTAWRGTEEQRIAEKTRIIKTGSKFAQALAKAAGVSLAGTVLR